MLDTTWETLTIPEPEPAGQVRATLVGLPPGFLQHNPNAMGGTGKTIPSAEEEAERSAYRWADGGLYLPSSHLYSALCNAAGTLKYRNIPTTRFGSRKLVAAAARPLADGFALLDESGEPITTFEIDTQRAIVQKNGILRSRALVPNWRAEVLLEIDLDVIGDAVYKIILDALTQAGRVVGIGDFRPQRGGMYGRFGVESFAYRTA